MGWATKTKSAEPFETQSGKLGENKRAPEWPPTPGFRSNLSLLLSKVPWHLRSPRLFIP